MADQTHKANTDEVNASIDAWRASQGLPPIDRAKSSRTLEASQKQPKKAKD